MLGVGWALAVMSSQSPRPAGEIPELSTSGQAVELRALVTMCAWRSSEREGAGIGTSKWAHHEEERPQWG